MKGGSRIPGRLSLQYGKWWLLGIFVLALWSYLCVADNRAAALPAEGRVTAVLDGDTVLLDSGAKVRYLGMDSPELAHEGGAAECYAREAREINAKLVLHNTVALQYGQEPTDAYGRLLAYVILPDGKCANAELLKKGCAWVYRTSKGFSRLQEFLALQREAIRKRSGMWGECSARPASYYVGNRRSFVMHLPDCSLGRTISRGNTVGFKTYWAGLEEGYHPCRRCTPLNGR